MQSIPKLYSQPCTQCNYSSVFNYVMLVAHQININLVYSHGLHRVEDDGRREVRQPAQESAYGTPVPAGLLHGPAELQAWCGRDASSSWISQRLHSWHHASQEEGRWQRPY